MTHDLDMILFEAASALSDAGERQAFLDHACGDDPARRRLLEGMLDARTKADEFFEFHPGQVEEERANARDPVEDETIHTRIGRYQLVERIGAGGCGAVYLAEQLVPIRRKVALKIIRLGMNTELVMARFEAERQALASMNHPAIARVLDGGATASGRPYFVMELVDGEKVTDFCDAHRLNVRQRLLVFLEICQAINHAHQKGLIHRDIKPSNILIRMEDGRVFPKVIDFGIAKVIADRTLDDGTLTQSEQFLGTPPYMSPEQAVGRLDLDTRSDIYSLGALLCELLTGRPPFDPDRLKSAGVDEIRKIMQREEPPKPSVILAGMSDEELHRAASLRRSDPPRLSSCLRGELDWIVMKAIAKDRDLRYETANGLLRDIERHLASEPVTAGPPGRLYQFRKLVQRNRIAFGAGASVVIALAMGFGTSTWLFYKQREATFEQQRLRREAELARANELQLRQRAESRGIIAQAAVRNSHGDVEGAATLLADVPPDHIPPSLEAASTFRAVGDWHVRNRRWEEAARAFTALADSLIAIDPADSDTVSQNLLGAAAALCQVNDGVAYERFRRLAIARFGHTTHPVVAEQIIKSTLLLPADEEMLAAAGSLQPIILDNDGKVREEQPLLQQWSFVALALLQYRNAEYEAAIRWCRLCIDAAESDAAQTVTSRIIMAMAEQRRGRSGVASGLLAEAGPTVEAKLAGPPQDGSDGYWFDWVNAGVLLREASTMMREDHAQRR